nr:hypothetical protein B0A51_05706 [Rachicladosporium sp. CCFEE 5018]
MALRKQAHDDPLILPLSSLTDTFVSPTKKANSYPASELTAPPTSMRSMNMPSFNAPSQAPQTRQPASRLQNTQKAPLGNGTSWGFGLPAPGAAGGAGFGGGLGGGIGAAGAGRGLGGLSGFAQVMGGGGGQGPIDMSDFPTLSGGPQPAGNAAQSSWNSNVLGQPTAQPQQPPQPQSRAQQQPPVQQRAPSIAPSQQSSLDQLENQRSQQSSVDRGVDGRGGDDFPPLNGQVNGDGYGHTNGFGSSLRSPESTQLPNNARQAQLPFRDGSNSTQQSAQAPIGHQINQPPAGPQETQQSPIPAPNGQSHPQPSTTKRYADMTESEKFGLEALSAAYEARKALETNQPVDETLPPIMRSGIFFGQDLNNLGLDLDSLEPLYPTFVPFPATNTSGSAFDFHDRHTVPDFELPDAYTVTNIPPLASRVPAMSDETLFCIFYQMPHDITQELAAQELHSRDWRWHKLLRQWLQKDTREANAASSVPILDLTNGAPVGVQPTRVTPGVEKGVYVFFDVGNWRRERREFVLNYEELDQRGPLGQGVMMGGAVGGGEGRGSSGVGGVGA